MIDMSKKTLITIPDDVITAIEEHNMKHPFAPFNTTNFCAAKLKEFFNLPVYSPEAATSQPLSQGDRPEGNTRKPQEKPRKAPENKTCAFCSGSMEGRSSQARYCSPECQNKAKVAKRHQKTRLPGKQ